MWIRLVFVGLVVIALGSMAQARSVDGVSHPSRVFRHLQSSSCRARVAGFVLTAHAKRPHRFLDADRYAPVGQAMFYPDDAACRGMRSGRWRG